MEMNKQKLRYILQYHFDQGDKAVVATRKICETYGPKTISNATTKRWFQRFRSGGKEVKDEPRSGRPVITDYDRIVEFVESDRHASLKMIGRSLNMDRRTVLLYLHKFGLKKRCDVWMPEELNQNNLLERINICDWLLKRSQFDPFLQRLVTGDVKYITFESLKKERSPSDCDDSYQSMEFSNSNDDIQKLLLCVWWDQKGIIYYELLAPGQKLTAALFCQQLNRLKEAIDVKRPELVQYGVVLLFDSARPHISLITRQKILELGWEVLLHPQNSPDLSPSEYHLFKHLQNLFNQIKLSSKEAVEFRLIKFFSKRQDFYRNGIMALPSKWSEVIQQKGAYLPE
ncbi:Histone-lysine N-methyltransferase SETMAR [Sarcoptes scabiei]|uniref:Histone-lysine N-methyltransferase SETMAR n=1 Tax=Sarcoptes scabiei TaxID=52283 RepID=A0A834RBL1_SARSC|nr:Histone-lysine N-methyltransferase SETMAR [Sarcoptes scabiei]